MRSRIAGVFFTVTLLAAASAAFAQEPPAQVLETQAKIDTQREKIKALDDEINKYEKELTVVSGQKRTLETTVKEIDLSRKKMTASIQKEERTIDGLEKEIADLDVNIGDAEATIGQLHTALSGLITQMHEAEEQSLVETILQTENVESIWDEIDSVEQVNLGLRKRVDNLQEKRASLAETRASSNTKRTERLNHQQTLVGQKRALDITQREKKDLLASTNQKETTYQRILEDKREAKLQFEAALQELESGLAYILDPSKIPPAGKGVLAWPLAPVTVTQKFGNTAFAQSGAYSGKGHNGVDFRAPVGTLIRAALSGTVIGTGNTDVYKGCYSYGKWVLIRHANGLSTLYAHLSSISVQNGDTISTGYVIGHSGNTGYSTGPHLHFSVYASGGVQVRRLGDVKSKTSCGPAEIPVAAYSAYLDPLEYL